MREVGIVVDVEVVDGKIGSDLDVENLVEGKRVLRSRKSRSDRSSRRGRCFRGGNKSRK